MLKINDITENHLRAICDAINRGHEVHIKTEKGGKSVAIVEEYRKLREQIVIDKIVND